MIDESKLNARMLLDTSVVVQALDEKRKDEGGLAVSRALWKAAVKSGRIVIAAPTFAELLRGGTPLTQPIEVVAFDRGAARLLAEKLPKTTMAEIREVYGVTRRAANFDAMIVACGLRHRAACLVSRDEKQRQIAEKAGLVAVEPEHFLGAQTTLFKQ